MRPEQTDLPLLGGLSYLLDLLVYIVVRDLLLCACGSPIRDSAP